MTIGSHRAAANSQHGIEMKNMTTVLYAVLMAAVIIAIDLMFFRNRFWERLIANVGIVLVFAVFYVRFLRRA